MNEIQGADILNWPKRYRTAFINSLSGFKSANLVGTQNTSGQTNLALFSSAVHIGAHPPLLGLISRPFTDTVVRHTLSNIRETGFYTVNHVHKTFCAQAHQTAARYPADQSEFEATALTPEYKGDFPAPFVQEAQVQIGLRLVEELPIRVNQTILFIGQIEQVYLADNILQDDGRLDLIAAGSVALSGLDQYHQASPIARFSYAKPKQPLTQLDK